MWVAIAVSAIAVAACAYVVRLGLAGGFAGYTYLFDPQRLARMRASFEALGDTDEERRDALERLLAQAHQKRIAECNERARRGMRRTWGPS